jgi:hypothetical protein
MNRSAKRHDDVERPPTAPRGSRAPASSDHRRLSARGRVTCRHRGRAGDRLGCFGGEYRDPREFTRADANAGFRVVHARAVALACTCRRSECDTAERAFVCTHRHPVVAIRQIRRATRAGTASGSANARGTGPRTGASATVFPGHTPDFWDASTGGTSCRSGRVLRAGGGRGSPANRTGDDDGTGVTPVGPDRFFDAPVTPMARIAFSGSTDAFCPGTHCRADADTVRRS